MGSVSIEPSRGWRLIDLREVWRFRELFYFLTWRDLKVRYKQTFFGVAWALLQPIILMVVFTIVFGRLGDVSSQGVPYPIFTYAALVPWTLFSQSLGAAADSLVSNSNLVTKVYFPRLILPLAAAGSFIVDFLIAMSILGGMMVFYEVAPTFRLLWLPLLFLLTVNAALAIGIWLSAINVRYRDVRYAVPFLMQVMLFVSPIAYSSQEVDRGVLRVLYSLNPMTGIAEGFRWSLLGGDLAPELIPISLGVVSVLLLTGLAYFRATERTFADLI